jgi:CRISPR/Cas system Type II protein with McrA/HNH and RuvC-like nuclease domain
VDHVIPRTFLQHDEIWNLVLAHDACNLEKSDLLPAVEYLEQLMERNEYFIASNHPIKRHLLQQLGETQSGRRAFLERTYAEAQRVLIHVWPGYPITPLRENPLTALHLIVPG